MNSHFKQDYNKKYKILKKLGVGNYTKVFQAENNITKELRAIKIIMLGDIKQKLEDEYSSDDVDKQLKKYINNLMNEIENMKICSENNDNSVKYYESFENENEFVIVLELCDESLTKFKKDKSFNSKEIFDLLNQLNNTFKIMKEKKIVHRDLKPDNILIKYNKK